MRVTSACPKPMPLPPARRSGWWMALLWGTFCAAVVAIALWLSPEWGTVHAEPADHAVPMAATVLYPHEPALRGMQELKK